MAIQDLLNNGANVSITISADDLRTFFAEVAQQVINQEKAAQAAKAKEQQNLDKSKAIMNNADNTQLSKVNNSVGLTAQQNKYLCLPEGYNLYLNTLEHK